MGELTRLKHICPIAQQQRIAAEVEAAIAEERFAESVSQDDRFEHYFGQYAVDFGSIRLKHRDLDLAIEECQEERARLMEHAIPPLLERLGELQETSVLEGDFDFKVARQDYYLSKQQRMLEHLAFQQARHKFLFATVQSETRKLERLEDIVSATISEMSLFQGEMNARQEEIEHLGKIQPIDQRQTVDARDNFTRRLNCMLDGKAWGKFDSCQLELCLCF